MNALQVAIIDDPEEGTNEFAAELEEFTSSVFFSSDSEGEGNTTGGFDSPEGRQIPTPEPFPKWPVLTPQHIRNEHWFHWKPELREPFDNIAEILA